MKRLFALLPLLALAGCEQMRPPTAEGLKIIAARTAKGTKNTKLEAKIQPDTPQAGQISIWEFKIFDIHDKPDKTRQEWKFFNALPQSSTNKATTEVLMNSWLISKDRTVFLPQKPLYKQYGTFLTDWTIPKNGPYALWVEYQPVVAKDELSFQDLKKAPALEVEHARWDFSAGGTATSKPLAPAVTGGNSTVYSLETSDYAASAPMTVTFAPFDAKLGAKTSFAPTINGANAASVIDQSLVALSPDGMTLLHSVGSNPQLTFKQKGKWRAWFSFSADDKSYVCPVDITVS